MNTRIEEGPHPWQSARDEFDELIMPKLNQFGRAIGASANNGNELAQTIITKYDMLRRSFDPLTMTILKESLDSWLKEFPQ